MPVYRDKDGNIIEEPTNFEGRKRKTAKKKKVIRGQDADDRFAAATKKAERSSDASNAAEKTATDDRFQKPTVKSGEKSANGAEAAKKDAGDRTRLWRPRNERTSAKEGQSKVAESGQEKNGEEDVFRLVTGWLVIVKGPGFGTALNLGYGSNTIGRGESNRVRVDFGDASISRDNHATLTYDGRGRQFYIQHGGGMNVTYLGERPVLAATELNAMDRLSLGDTEFAFVPFCGSDFDWNDEDEDS